MRSKRSVSTPGATFSAELDRQLGVLIGKGYPSLAGMSDAEFRALVAPLRGVGGTGSDGSYPFVLVIGRDVVPVADAADRIEREGHAPTWMLEHDELQTFV